MDLTQLQCPENCYFLKMTEPFITCLPSRNFGEAGIKRIRNLIQRQGAALLYERPSYLENLLRLVEAKLYLAFAKCSATLLQSITFQISLQVIRTFILVFQVTGMFPNIHSQDRRPFTSATSIKGLSWLELTKPRAFLLLQMSQAQPRSQISWCPRCSLFLAMFPVSRKLR